MTSIEVVRGLWFVALLCHGILASKELKGFQENATVDFNSGKILADIVRTGAPKLSSQRAINTRHYKISTESAPISFVDEDLDASITAQGTNELSMTVTHSDTLKDFEMTQDMPPRITKPSSQMRVIVPETQKKFFSYQCESDGFPTPLYEWYRNDLLVDGKGEHIRGFENGTLQLRNFSSREHGVFQCRAKNKFGTSLSVKLPIFLETPPEKLPDSPVVEQTVKEGDPTALYCDDTPATIPEYITRWYLEGGTKEVQLDERIGMDSNGTLRFTFTERNDTSNYLCSLVPHSAGSQHLIRFYNKVKLEVSPRLKEPLPPKKEFASSNVKAYLGKNVTLECFFSGYPRPNIQWQNRMNQVIDTTMDRFQIIDFSRQLVIKYVTEEDEGIFKCVATNAKDMKHVIINVNVTSPPLLIINNGVPSSLTSKTMPDQRDVTLHCKSRGAPGETINTPIWYKNGNALNKANLPDRYSFNDRSTELTIKDLTTEDTACFQCNITNSEGYLFFDGYLKVIKSINLYRQPEQSINVLESYEFIDLSVKASGDACCPLSFTRYFNSTLIKREELVNPPFFHHSDDGALFLNRTSVPGDQLASRMGQYTVVVSNNYETRNVTFKLYMGEADQKMLAAEAGGLRIWVVILICGLLAILIAVLVIVIVIKSNYPRDTYPLEKTELKHHLNPEEDLLNLSFQDI